MDIFCGCLCNIWLEEEPCEAHRHMWSLGWPRPGWGSPSGRLASDSEGFHWPPASSSATDPARPSDSRTHMGWTEDCCEGQNQNFKSFNRVLLQHSWEWNMNTHSDSFNKTCEYEDGFFKFTVNSGFHFLVSLKTWLLCTFLATK